MKKKLLLLGLDSLDWKVINPLLEKGLLPNIQKLIKNGSKGQLETLDPPFSPMLWTSIATGKTADKHGIHGFIEPDVASGTVRPVSSVSRNCKALWNIFTNQGLKSNVIGWWPSTPAEPINGIMVSNNFQKDIPDKEKWDLDPSEIYPQELTDEFKSLRVHPTEINPQLVLDFVPEAAGIDQDKNHKLSPIVKELAHSFSIRNAAIHAMKKGEWNFTAVYFDGPDHFSHGFMKYHPPQLSNVSDEDFNLYKNVINACYILHDVLVGELVDVAGDNCDVVLLSDHGFHSDHLRPLSLPKFSAAPALEHNPFGVLITSGKAFKNGLDFSGKNLLNITPTILHYFGLPIGEDMDGSVIEEAFEKTKAVDKIVSWENVPGEFGEHDEFLKDIGMDDAESIKQLEELGYIEREEGKSAEERVKKAIQDGKYNLSKVYAWKGDKQKAIELVEELYQENPSDVRFNIDLINHYIEKGLFKSAENLITKFKKTEGVKYVRIAVTEAKLLRLQNRIDEAIPLLLSELKERPNNASIKLELAACYRINKDYKNVVKTCDEIIVDNPNNALAFRDKGISLFNLKQYEQALEELFKCVNLKPKALNGHYYIAKCLAKLNHLELAAQAYETTLHLNPNYALAKKDFLAFLISTKGDNLKIKELEKALENKEQEAIYIVTGLPRSGTSMTMQMLEAAGVPIFTDNQRTPDDNNPKGYYEYEPVKQLHKKNNWLDDVKEKGLKVVMPHVFKLPPRYRYKVIHINRKLDDVLVSQETMKQRLNPNHVTQFSFGLYQKFNNELVKLKKWSESNSNIEFLVLDYDQVVSSPLVAAEKLLVFIGNKDIDLAKIAKTVDKDLKRSNV